MRITQQIAFLKGKYPSNYQWSHFEPKVEDWKARGKLKRKLKWAMKDKTGYLFQ